MSAGNEDNQRGNAHHIGPVFFSNYFMSDSESDWSPIHNAAFNGHVIALQNLIAQGSCVNLATLDRVTPLHGACIQGNAVCTKLLLENGANVNSPTVDGTTPLSEACTHGHLTSVSLLLQHGANPLGTSQSDSPIHRAAAKGQAECIEVLVQHGADVDQHFDPSGSPLHIACSNQHLHTAKTLLQLGASVNNNEASDSPLHIAACLSNHEMVSLLLEHGADRSLRNSRHQRPVDLAPPNSLAERLLRHTAGVSRLVQLCRLYIRKNVGKQRLGGIHGLDIPIELKQYLLYQIQENSEIYSIAVRNQDLNRGPY